MQLLNALFSFGGGVGMQKPQNFLFFKDFQSG